MHWDGAIGILQILLETLDLGGIFCKLALVRTEEEACGSSKEENIEISA
jgi:hypothetical protein